MLEEMIVQGSERYVVAISGASGMPYARELLSLLAGMQVEVHGIISDAGRQVLRLESDMAAEDLPGVDRWFDCADFSAPMASGSSRYRAMIVVPCTMATLGAIASGNGRNLIHRAADVMLKEGRPLLLAVRETPLGRIHLRNMLELCEAGATICPLMPGFYQRPADLDQLARNMAARLCDLLGLEPPGMQRWAGQG